MKVYELIELLKKVETEDAVVYVGPVHEHNLADTVIVQHDMFYSGTEGVSVIIKGEKDEI